MEQTDLKTETSTKNVTVWKDRVQSSVHIHKVTLSVTPTSSYCLFFLKASDSVLNHSISHPVRLRQKQGHVSQSSCWSRLCFHTPCWGTVSSPSVSTEWFSQRSSFICSGFRSAETVWKFLCDTTEHADLSYFPLIIYAWRCCLPARFLFFSLLSGLLMYLNSPLHTV